MKRGGDIRLILYNRPATRRRRFNFGWFLRVSRRWWRVRRLSGRLLRSRGRGSGRWRSPEQVSPRPFLIDPWFFQMNRDLDCYRKTDPDGDWKNISGPQLQTDRETRIHFFSENRSAISGSESDRLFHFQIDHWFANYNRNHDHD